MYNIQIQRIINILLCLVMIGNNSVISKSQIKRKVMSDRKTFCFGKGKMVMQ